MSEAIVAPPDIVVCVPGPWESRAALQARLAADSAGYVYAGPLLLHAASERSFELDHVRHDERMAGAFRAAGARWTGTPEMAAIAGHASVVYLITPGGSRANAEAMMGAAQALIDAGGLGVKVETSGLAYPPADWRRLCAERHLFSAHRAFVLCITGSEVHTCGMHNLGLRDVVVGNFDTESALTLVRTFSWYLFSQSPTIQAGQTFSVAADAPVYRIEAHPGVNYGEGSLFSNPYGAWRLSRA